MTNEKTISKFRVVRKRIKQWKRFLLSPHFGKSEFKTHFQQLGVKPGTTLLVHSSLSAFGYVQGGIDTVIESLIEYLGSEGTLMMPAHCWRSVNSGGRSFDLVQSQCCVGTIAEHFRNWPNVSRSLHPSHSVCCLGKDATELISGHEHADSPCGDGTPYAKLFQRNGQVLLLGVPLRRNTCFHTLETQANVSYLLKDKKESFRVIDQHGVCKDMNFRCHQKAVPSRFDELENELLKHQIIRKAQLNGSQSTLIEADRLKNYLLPILQSDENYLRTKK